jgi:hypothetical protein
MKGQQTFHERPHLSRDVAKIDWGTQDDGGGLLGLAEDRCQVILYGTLAVTFAVPGPAGKAAYASLEVESSI